MRSPARFLPQLVLCALLFLTFAAAQIALDSISPDHGPRFGGTTVTLTGQDLHTVTTVTINGVTAQIQAGATSESLTAITGNSNPNNNGIGEVVLNSVGTGVLFTYIDPSDVFDVKGTVGKQVSLGELVKADVSGATTVTISITDIAAGITVTQFDDTAVSGPFPVAVTDEAARIKVTFPASAGRTDVAISYAVETEGGDQEYNHINVLALEQACSVASLVPPLGVEFVSPPAPTSFQMTYVQATQTFAVTVVMSYLRDGAIVALDLANDYQPNTHGIRDVHATTKCNSRSALLAADVPIYDLFYSAPTATFPDALESALYHAYPPTTALWSASGTACNEATYQGSFTFAQLVACDNHDGSPAVSVTSAGGKITYSGSVWVSVMQPLDTEKENTTFHTSQFQYPFSFEFNSAVQAINTITSTQDLVVDVVSANVATSDPRVLTVVLKTTSSVDAVDSTLASVGVTGLFAGATTIATSSAPACESGTATCVQQWTYTSAGAWELSFNGEYRFAWSFDAGASEASAVLNLQHVLTPSTTETDLDLATVSLSFYDSESDMVAGDNSHLGAFGNADRVHVRATLDIDGGAADNFGLTIDDLYICWENNAVFDVSLPSGCEASFIPSNQVVHLIAAGAADNTNDPAKRFSPSIHSVPDNAAGASFAAQPLATRSLAGETIHVHMKLTIVQNGSSRRSVVVLTGRADPTKASLASFMVNLEEDSASSLSKPFWAGLLTR